LLIILIGFRNLIIFLIEFGNLIIFLIKFGNLIIFLIEFGNSILINRTGFQYPVFMCEGMLVKKLRII